MIKTAGIAAAAALLTTALTGCEVGAASVTNLVQDEAATPLPVEISQPGRADIYATYQTTSTLTADSEALVPARIAGEVIEILVEEGDRVERGQVLARLDGERMRLEMLQAKAELDRVTKEYERLVGLHKRGLVSAAMYDGLRFDIDALEATYELKRLDYSYTSIRAPISGIVSSREIKIGRQLYVNDIAFRITDTSTLVAQLKIPQSELVKFSAGHTMTLNVDAMPELMLSANIDRISPTIDVTTGTFRATAYVDNSDGPLAPGMFARFSIAYEKHENALVIPATALLDEDNIAVVYVVTDGAAKRRVITTGIESEGMVEVLDGLEPSESIVVSGQTGLRDGSKVLASNLNSNTISG